MNLDKLRTLFENPHECKIDLNSLSNHFFILGEHDISRIRTTPIPYVYHNLEFSKYIGQGKPIKYKEILIAGFDKIRKAEIPQYEEKFKEIDKIVQNHSGHKILVLHQGITEFNKFAGEIQSTDLQRSTLRISSFFFSFFEKTYM